MYDPKTNDDDSTCASFKLLTGYNTLLADQNQEWTFVYVADWPNIALQLVISPPVKWACIVCLSIFMLMENLECVDGILFLMVHIFHSKYVHLELEKGVYIQSWRGEQEKSSHTLYKGINMSWHMS